MRILILNFLLFVFANGILAQTVTIGNQIWSTKNLDLTTFRNGDLILEAKTKEEWLRASHDGIPAYCYYENNPLNKEKYGLLYNGYVLSDPRGIAPNGWVLPSKRDWLDLLTNTNTEFTEIKEGVYKSTDTDKFRSQTLWSDNINGTNQTGLLIFPSGGRNSGDYLGMNVLALFWSSEEKYVNEAFSILFSSEELYLVSTPFETGASIRCIKDNFNNSRSETEQPLVTINSKSNQNNIAYNSNSKNKKSFIGSNIINTNEKNFKNDYKRLNKDFSDYSQLIKKIESDSNSIKEYTKNGLDKKLLVQNYQFINNSSIYKPNDKAIEKILKKYDINKDDFLTANSNNILINVNLIDQEDNFLILPKQNFNIDKIKLDFKLVRKLLKEDLMYVLDSEKERFCKSLTNLDQNYFRLEKNIQENSSLLKKLNTEKLIATQNLIYFGDKVNNDKSGFGVLVDNVNDTLFIGYWKDDKPDLLNGKVFCYNHEQDVLYFNYGNIIFGSSKQGSVFLGEKKNNLYQGNVTLVYNSGGYYKGYFEGGLKTGKGIEQFSDGNKYEGDFLNDELNGKGKYYFAKGDFYEGDWLNGKKNGYGVYKYIDGSIYEGNYKDGKFNGQGKYYFSKGDIYEGDWLNGKKQGKGIYKYKSGSIYDGYYFDDLRNGYGTYTWKGGEKYIGNYKNDEFDGKGKYTWADGAIYEGDFVNGVKSGNGKYIWSNGDVYDGEYNNDERTGKGKLTYSNGEVENGTWINGYLISSNNDSPPSNKINKTNDNQGQNNQKQCPKCGNFFQQDLGWSYQFERVDEKGKIKSLVIRKDGENCNPRRIGAGMLGGGDFKYCSCFCAKIHNGEY
jgi:uncharacterized protein (TIGR02145 family)